MPREVFRDLYHVGGDLDFDFSMSKEDCKKILEQMKDIADEDEIDNFYQKTKSDKVNPFVVCTITP